MQFHIHSSIFQMELLLKINFSYVPLSAFHH